MNNILLVEDDKSRCDDQQAFKKNHINHPLYIASNGLEALVLLHYGKPPVIPENED